MAQFGCQMNDLNCQPTYLYISIGALSHRKLCPAAHCCSWLSQSAYRTLGRKPIFVSNKINGIIAVQMN